MAHRKTREELIIENACIKREAVSLKEEVRLLYAQNATINERLRQFENETEFRSECQTQVARLRGLLSEIKGKQERPNQREEIKDRIIMKLEDQLITARLQLKEVQLQLSRFSRIQ